MSKPIIKLNTEQKKLVEDNHDLIYGFMTKYKLDFSTWYDVCAIGLCKAGAAYDGSNRFSTLAYYCMHNEVKNAKRTQSAKKRNDSRVVSLNCEVKTVYNEDVPLEAVIDSGAKNEEYTIGKDWADWFIENLPLNTLKILYERMQGFTCQEIAIKIGITTSRVAQILKNLRQYCDEERRYSPNRQDNENERQIYLKKIKKFLDS